MALQESRLQDFGGVAEVVLHFRQASCREASRNLFSVLLDWASSKIEVSPPLPAEGRLHLLPVEHFHLADTFAQHKK